MTIELRHGSAAARVNEQEGAVLESLVLAFAGESFELLTPPPSVGARFDGLPMFGCFAMVPFCNRLLPTAMLSSSGLREVEANWPVEGCTVHGLGWNSPWTIEEQSENHCLLSRIMSDIHGAELGVARQEIRLASDSTAELSLSFENTSEDWLDVGLGFHPWFWAPDKQGTARFQADGYFVPDERLYPVRLEKLSDKQTTIAAADNNGLDRCYAGWNGRAELDLPRLPTPVVVKSDQNCLHIFVDHSRDSFCVEPVSHITNATHDRRWDGAQGMTRVTRGKQARISFSVSL